MYIHIFALFCIIYDDSYLWFHVINCLYPCRIASLDETDGITWSPKQPNGYELPVDLE